MGAMASFYSLQHMPLGTVSLCLDAKENRSLAVFVLFNLGDLVNPQNVQIRNVQIQNVLDSKSPDTKSPDSKCPGFKASRIQKSSIHNVQVFF
jgi:hypothetical protein